jgi:hypothetical protein
MPTSIQLKVVVAIVIVFSLAFATMSGRPFPFNFLSSFSYVIAACSVTIFFWEHWMWAWRVFRPWLNTRPDLRGTWKGQLLSNWADPQTGHRSGPIEAYLVVRQTYSSISVQLFSLQSISASLSASIVTEAEGLRTLFVTYRNVPSVLLREDSPIHYGGMMLLALGVPAIKLDGEYWTDRRTKGAVTFLSRVKLVAQDFTHAAGFFG